MSVTVVMTKVYHLGRLVVSVDAKSEKSVFVPMVTEVALAPA